MLPCSAAHNFALRPRCACAGVGAEPLGRAGRPGCCQTGASVSAVASSPVPFVGAPGAGAWAWSAGEDATADTKNRRAAARLAGLARRGLQAPDRAARPVGRATPTLPSPGPGWAPRRVPADLLSEGAALRHGCGGAGLGAGLGGLLLLLLLLLALPFALPPARSPVGSPDPTARLGRPLEPGTRVPYCAEEARTRNLSPPSPPPSAPCANPGWRPGWKAAVARGSRWDAGRGSGRRALAARPPRLGRPTTGQWPPNAREAGLSPKGRLGS